MKSAVILLLLFCSPVLTFGQDEIIVSAVEDDPAAGVTQAWQSGTATLGVGVDSLSITIPLPVPRNRTRLWLQRQSTLDTNSRASSLGWYQRADDEILVFRYPTSSLYQPAFSLHWQTYTDSENVCQSGVIKSRNGTYDTTFTVPTYDPTKAYVEATGKTSATNSTYNSNEFPSAWPMSGTSVRIYNHPTGGDEYISYAIWGSSKMTVTSDSIADNSTDLQRTITSDADTVRQFYSISQKINASAGRQVSPNSSVYKRDKFRLQTSTAPSGRTVYYHRVELSDVLAYPVPVSMSDVQTSVTTTIPGGVTLSDVNKAIVIPNGIMLLGGLNASANAARRYYSGITTISNTTEILTTRASTASGYAYSPQPYLLQWP